MIVEMLANVNLEKDLQLVNQNGVIVVRYFILSVTSHIKWSVAHCLINKDYLTACAFIRS